jgi:ribose 1,5-bisphosphokinase PhnN
MVARLTGAPLMGIVGPSGSGKSSVLRWSRRSPRHRRAVGAVRAFLSDDTEQRCDRGQLT